MSAEHGEWTVDCNDTDTGIIIEFSVIGEAGVENFRTAMPPENALAFADAVREKVMEMEE